MNEWEGREFLIDDGDAGTEGLVANIIGEVGDEGGMEGQTLTEVAKAGNDQMHSFIRVGINLFAVEWRVGNAVLAETAEHVFCPLVFHGEGIQLQTFCGFRDKCRVFATATASPCRAEAGGTRAWTGLQEFRDSLWQMFPRLAGSRGREYRFVAGCIARGIGCLVPPINCRPFQPHIP